MMTVAMMVATPGALAATDWYVDASATTSGVGTSWATAFNNLQDALPPNNTLSSGDKVFVAGGTYRLTTSADSFTLVGGVSIQGDYVGQSGLLTGTENHRTEESILSGDVDNDGDTDVVIGNAAGPVRFFTGK